MFRRLSIVAGLLAVAGMAFGALAPAASAEEGVPDVVLRGRGVLDAEGTGLAAVKGRIDYTATADEAVLLVKDVAGDADVDVDGHGGTGMWNGFHVYFGFEGRAHITGSDVAVIVVGRDIDLRVVGRGWAYLKGRGTYEVNHRGPLPWNEDGGFAAVEPDAGE